jgi:hypothetical protein
VSVIEAGAEEGKATMKKFGIVSLGVIALLVSTVTVVRAGLKQVAANVYVYNAANGYAYGVMGDARNSIDNDQYIGCSVYKTVNGYKSVSCYAVDPSGTNWTSCTTSNADLTDIAEHIGPTSYVYFAKDGSNCFAISIGNHSYNRPMTP